VVRLVSIDLAEVQIQTAFTVKARKNSSNSLTSKSPHPHVLHGAGEHQIGPPAEIHGGLAERLVHRQLKEPVAADAAAVAQRLVETRASTKPTSSTVW
jgi:hypothetical protein